MAHRSPPPPYPLLLLSPAGPLTRQWRKIRVFVRDSFLRLDRVGGTQENIRTFHRPNFTW